MPSIGTCRGEAARTVQAPYEYDASACIGFLQKYGPNNEGKLSIEQGHAISAGHSFADELATAAGLGVMESIDMNRNDHQTG